MFYQGIYSALGQVDTTHVYERQENLYAGLHPSFRLLKVCEAPTKEELDGVIKTALLNYKPFPDLTSSHNKDIYLPFYDTHIILKDKDGSITSTLREGVNEPEFLIGLDVLESVILSHACAGIDVSSPAYLKGLETTIEALYNKYT